MIHELRNLSRLSVAASEVGLSEYDVRRPLTDTGTNLLGLIKHLSTWEARYFGEVFDRPFPEPLSRWDDESERLADMFGILVHVLAETSRHAGHADILREQLDGAVGTDAESMAEQWHDAAFWANRRAIIEQAARAADPTAADPTKAPGAGGRMAT